MYKTATQQVSFYDFNQSCGFQLDNNNDWVVLANNINWAELEIEYAKLFPSFTGNPAKPLRMSLGSLIIQKRLQLSDRNLIKTISENPYLQYFIGMKSFGKCPFQHTSLVFFRKRFNAEFLMRANELYLKTANPTKEHTDDKKLESADGLNLGTFILDATCSPSNIKYPQDYVLLNDAREKTDKIIDYFNSTYRPWSKPRTYREVARRDYLAVAKNKRRSEKAIRSLIRKQLECIRRNIGYIEKYIEAGYSMPEKYVKCYETIQELYKQQKYMYVNHTHQVDNRIVSISQPYIRPIVRGKAKTPTEFGAKYDVSIDEKGHARLERIQFDSYNESTVFVSAIEKYYERTGHYPVRALVDQIYRNKKNRDYCKEHGIRMSGPKLGRPSNKKENTKEAKQIEYQDNVDRIEVERFISKEKKCCGAGLIVTKLDDNTIASIALSVFVTNLFSIPVNSNKNNYELFLFVLIGSNESECSYSLVLFE